MNTKEAAVIGVGLAVVVAMALYPPWATWCQVDFRDRLMQYGWLFGRLNYPECAEKLTDWRSATTSMWLGDPGDAGVDGYVPVSGHPTASNSVTEAKCSVAPCWMTPTLCTAYRHD